MAYTLINARPSPFGRKVAIAMLEKGIEFDVKFDVPWGDQTCTPQYSPLQQLPILITEQDEYIYDSAYILDWLEARYPEPALLPAALDSRLDAQKRRMLGERMMEVVLTLVFELHRAEPSAPWVERQSRKIHGALAELDRMYGERTLQGEPELDLGDIAVATSLLGIEFAAKSGLCADVPVLRWRENYAALDRAVSALEPRPSFAKTMPQMMDVDLQATVA